MKSFVKAIPVIIVVVCFLGCASTTKLTETWQSPAYTGGKIKNVLVIAITKQAGKRDLFEKAFVEAFKAHGLAAQPSTSLLPEGTELTREAVSAAIKDAGIDSVFAMKLIEVKEKEVYTPPHVSYDSYGYMRSMVINPVPDVYMPGYYATHVKVKLETTLYETTDGKLIWATLSETYNPESADDLLVSYKKQIMRDLKKSGFID